MKPILSLIAALCLMGCAQHHYNRVATGTTFEGDLIVQWLAHDRFRYLPSPARPFTIHRPGQAPIIPTAFETDGGSTPRIARVFRNYSPWGYGPAFVAHDWLFEAHHCDLPEYRAVTLDDAADVMSEIIKEMMENRDDFERDAFALYTIDKAVRSGIARSYWDAQPPCTIGRVGDGRSMRKARGEQVLGEFVLSY